MYSQRICGQRVSILVTVVRIIFPSIQQTKTNFNHIKLSYIHIGGMKMKEAALYCVEIQRNGRTNHEFKIQNNIHILIVTLEKKSSRFDMLKREWAHDSCHPHCRMMFFFF